MRINNNSIAFNAYRNVNATEGELGKTMGTVAVALAAVNVFGGFLVTRRMLEMFKKKDKKAKGEAA